jgi:hypothetical protein
MKLLSTILILALTIAGQAAIAKTGPKWKPALGDSWQWQLQGKINTSYDVVIYDIDLFEAPQSVIDALHAKGRHVICYFSAGSSENWRPDFRQFNEMDKGRPLDGWPGERWLDIRSANVRRIMKARLDLAVRKHCDGVEPDNVEGYSNGSGLGLTRANQVNFNRFLAAEAHSRGLAIGLKNDLPDIPALVGVFDFAVNEECNQYDECGRLRPFLRAGKPVFSAEYAAKYRKNTNGARDAMCTAMNNARIHTLVLPLLLDDKFRFSCDGH